MEKCVENNMRKRNQTDLTLIKIMRNVGPLVKHNELSTHERVTHYNCEGDLARKTSTVGWNS